MGQVKDSFHGCCLFEKRTKSFKLIICTFLAGFFGGVRLASGMSSSSVMIDVADAAAAVGSGAANVKKDALS